MNLCQMIAADAILGYTARVSNREKLYLNLNFLLFDTLITLLFTFK